MIGRMLPTGQYELLDFGGGRKLERFGDLLIDRPSPAADGLPRGDPTRWREAAARYERTAGDQGVWRRMAAESSGDEPIDERWTIHHGPLTLELRLTDFGQVGVFPEQTNNWDWIAAQVRRCAAPPRILNLFAYTGAATLAAAAAGAQVTHVDAARTTVAWARRNAEFSGLSDRSIRWIVEDAPTFVRRELKRGRQYHAVILDPPSYGHGPNGEVWKLAEDLPELLSDCAKLTAGDLRFMLLTSHTPGFGPAVLGRLLADAFDISRVESDELALCTSSGRRLPCGAMARFGEL